MLKTYEELYPSTIKNYIRKHSLHCIRKSKGVFKFVPIEEYSNDYKFIVHVCDSYTNDKDPVCVNMQAHASRNNSLTSCWLDWEEIEFINALYSFFWGIHVEIKKEENL